VLFQDEELYAMLYDFSERYWDATHPVERTRMTASAASDILVTLILAIFTAGVGAAVNVAAKSGKLGKAAKLLKKITETIKRTGSRHQVPKKDLGDGAETIAGTGSGAGKGGIPEVESPKEKPGIDDGGKKGHDTAEVKPKPKEMEKFKPNCFKPSDGLKDTFKDNPQKMEKEFYRQLKDQENGINKLTAGEYLDNRKGYSELIQEHGNQKAREILTNGGKTQKAARQKLEDKITDSVVQSLEKKGIYGAEAERIAAEKAKEQLNQLAALHDPDMIAGGHDEIARVANKNVNSSLGSQWKTRVSEMDEAAEKTVQQHGRDVKMNVELERCKH
jgi:hypothetical protein